MIYLPVYLHLVYLHLITTTAIKFIRECYAKYDVSRVDYRQTARQFLSDANQLTASEKSTRQVGIIWINNGENARADRGNKNRNACQPVIIAETSVGVWPGR